MSEPEKCVHYFREQGDKVTAFVDAEGRCILCGEPVKQPEPRPELRTSGD